MSRRCVERRSHRHLQRQVPDLYLTCGTLAGKGIAAAASFLPGELPGDQRFPLFIKPRFGRGSVCAYTIRDGCELAFFLQYVDGPVVQEYLDGPEFTIDLLCDFSGRPLSVRTARTDPHQGGGF